MNIRKSDGTIAPFKSEKLDRSLSRARVKPEVAKSIIDNIEKLIRPGTSTQHIHDRILTELEKLDPVGAARYNLKHSMLQLGPSGYPFEQFIARLMHAYGWKVETGTYLQGKCVSHEVDIYGVRDNEERAVEAKYRNKVGAKVDIKTALYVQARHEDLRAVNKNVRGVLITNTEFTRSAIAYGECMEMKMKAWNYPKNEGLAKYIEQKNLYPITVFSNTPKHVIGKLLRENVVLVDDLAGKSDDELRSYGINAQHVSELRSLCTALCTKEA